MIRFRQGMQMIDYLAKRVFSLRIRGSCGRGGRKCDYTHVFVGYTMQQLCNIE